MKFRRFSEPLIGPLASWELVRLARRGHAHRARLLVLYLLCLGLGLILFVWFSNTEFHNLFSFDNVELPADSNGALGNWLVFALWEGVLFGVAAMMPGFAALAVAQEKESDSLQMLLTTPLSDREIILGKAAGRLGFVLAGAAAAIPLISVCDLFGAVNVWIHVSGCVLTCSTATLCAAIGVQAACATHDLRKALIRAYGMAALAVVGVIVNPFLVLYLIAEALDSGAPAAGIAIVYPLLQVGFAVAFFRTAIREIRREGNEPTSAQQKYYFQRDEWLLGQGQPLTQENEVQPPEADDEIWDSSTITAPIPRFPSPEMPLPAVSESNPLLWKERYVSGRNTGAMASGRPLPLTLLIAGLAILFILLGTIILVEQEISGKSSFEYGGHFWLAGGALASGTYLVPCAIGLAAAIARERHKKTLDTLLSLPIDRREILRTKVRSVLERAALLVPVAIVGPGIAFGVERDWRLGLAASGFVIGGMILVFGLGTLLSVRCPSEVRALRLLAPVVVLVLGVPVAIWNADKAIEFRWAVFDLAAFSVLATAAGLISWFRAGRLLEKM